MEQKPTAEQIAALFHMIPLSKEGGMKVDYYRSNELLPRNVLPGRAGELPMGSSILYLLQRGGFSRMHRLKSDELFHFYMGGACEMLLLYPDGHGEKRLLGTDLLAGARPQIFVPRGVWQGTRLLEDDYALLGCTMAPAYSDLDFDAGDYTTLAAAYPAFADALALLCGCPRFLHA